MSTGKVKCGVRDGLFIEPCDSLVSATEYGNPRGKQKGIWMWNLWDMDTHKPSRSYFGTKSGDHVQKGLLFNFCPFCGEKIDAPFTDRAAISAGAQDGQAVDDARDDGLPCQHENCKAKWNYILCSDCGSVRTDHEWGIAAGMRFKSLAEAEFYRANGRLPEQDTAMSASRPDDKGEAHE